MKKRIAALAAAIALSLTLAGCSGAAQKPSPLPDGMTQEVLLAEGQEVVDLLLAQNYEAVYLQFRDDIQENLTVEKITDLVSPALEKTGAVEKLEESAAVGVSGEEGVEAHGIAQFRYECEKRDLAFSLAFDPDMELIGLNAEVGRGSFKFSNIIPNLLSFFNKDDK